MKLLFTKELLHFLRSKGFRYCYSRTTLAPAGDHDVVISLTPTKKRPNVRKLPEQFDTYFRIDEEPVQMAEGIADTLVFAELEQALFIEFIGSVLQPLPNRIPTPHPV